MYRSPNYGKRYNRGNGPTAYFLTETYQPVYSSQQGAKWQVLGRSLEEAVANVEAGNILKMY